MITRKQIRVLKYIVDKLNRNKITFQVHGGLAAFAYGAKRPLYDIDIDVYKKDIPLIKKLFKKYIVEDFHHESDNEFDLYLMTIKIDGVLIDFDQVEQTYYIDKNKAKIRIDPDLNKAKLINISDVVVPIEDKNELIKYKKILARDVDLKDLSEISN